MTTTAEFDTTGFAAVNDFFGEVVSDGPKRTGEVGRNVMRGKKRGGVGAGIVSSTTRSSSVLNDTVLKVGRKRRGRDDDDDDDGEDERDINSDDDDDDDLVQGRTAIVDKAVTKKSSRIENKQQGTIGPSHSRKPGRKERQKGKLTVSQDNNRKQETVEASKSLIDTVGLSSSPVQHNDHGNEGDETNHPGKKESTSTSSQQRKRRKVRSRQKNIRKDNRSLQEKPSHLIPGTPLYQGRPITPATRERLNQQSLLATTTSTSSFSNGTIKTNGGGKQNPTNRPDKRGNKYVAKKACTTSTKPLTLPPPVPETGFIIDRDPRSGLGDDDIGVAIAS